MWPLIAVLDQPGNYAIAWENGQLHVRKVSELQEKGARIIDVSKRGGSNG